MAYAYGGNSATWKPSGSSVARYITARLCYETWEDATNFYVGVIGGITVYKDNLGLTVNGELYLTDTDVTTGSKTYTYNSKGSNHTGVYYDICGYKYRAYPKTTSAYTVSATMYGYRSGHYSDIYSHASMSFTVPALVKGEITSAPNFNDTDNPWVGFSMPSSGYSSCLLCIADSNASGIYVGYREVSNGGYTFNLSDAERNTLRNASSQSNSLTVSFVLRTTFGDTTLYSVSYRTLYITDAYPSISASVYDSDTSIVNITGNNQILVKGYSDVSWSISSSGKKGAWISSNNAYYKDSGGNIILSQGGTSGGWNDVSYGKFTFSATDSRGNTSYSDIDLTIVNYFKPSLDIDLEISSAGVMTINPKGSYFDGDLGKTHNSMALSIKWRKSGDEWTELPVRSNFDSITIEGLDYTELYEVEASLRDTLEVLSVSKSVRSLPVFDWSDSDFNFNVPITITDANTGFITSFNGAPKVLWGDFDPTHSLWMKADQNIQLSEPLLKQTNGIILMWSYYESDLARDWDWSYQFIPKYHAYSNHTFGNGINFFTSCGNTLVRKYVYVTNTTILGNDLNASDPYSFGGLTMYPKRMVLRAVLGV